MKKLYWYKSTIHKNRHKNSIPDALSLILLIMAASSQQQRSYGNKSIFQKCFIVEYHQESFLFLVTEPVKLAKRSKNSFRSLRSAAPLHFEPPRHPCPSPLPTSLARHAVWTRHALSVGSSAIQGQHTCRTDPPHSTTSPHLLIPSPNGVRSGWQ